MNTADNAQMGLSDIGVKNGNTRPHTADEEIISGTAAAPSPNAEAKPEAESRTVNASELHTDDADSEKLEAEFDELVRTRYRAAYQKRTEGIIRKRLKNVKGRQNFPGASNGGDISPDAAERESAQKELQLRQNIARPSENGVSVSVGRYAKTEVSSLTSRDVREILKRAGNGEKIRFK